MVLTLLCILFLSVGGAVLTYLYSDDDSPLVRLAAGNVVGSCVFSLIVFLIGSALGFTASTILLSLAAAILPPLALLINKNRRERFFGDFGRLPEVTAQALPGVLFYAAFLVLFYFFFERAMLVTPQGILTGSSHNLGDLPFHLGAIFSFTEGGNLPPENPSYAFAKFTYPFMADLLAACFVKLGASVRDAMLWQNITLAMSLVVIMENFAGRMMRNRLAGKLAAVILLFCGGLGFIIFFRDYWRDGRSLLEFVWYLQSDYTIREKGIRWGNSLTALFLTQRSLLLGMPLVLVVLTHLWKIFTSEKRSAEETVRSSEAENPESATNSARTENLKSVSFISLFSRFSVFPSFFIGLLAGMLPIVHVHSLAVLFVVTAFLFFFRLDKWREWIAFGVGVCLIAVPELLYIMSGSATSLSQFLDWHFGWDRRGENVIVFWAKNLGLFAPLLALAFWWLFKTRGGNAAEEIGNEEKRKSRDKGQDIKARNSGPENLAVSLALFHIPFLVIFIACNLVKFAPWEWDNIKLLIYWFAASVPLVAWLLARLWENGGGLYKFAATACLFVLMLSGALDIWRVLSKSINYRIFSSDGVLIAEQIKQKTAPKALFLNAPTYNTPIVLAGRRSLMRYGGHLLSYGIDNQPREWEVKRIYEGTAMAEILLRRHGIDYVLIGPEERDSLKVNEQFFSRYPLIAEAGEYRVYQVKK